MAAVGQVFADPNMRRLDSSAEDSAALPCLKSATDSGCVVVPVSSVSSCGSERQDSSSSSSSSSKDSPFSPLSHPMLHTPYSHGRSISISVVPCSHLPPRPSICSTGDELQDAFSPDSDPSSPSLPQAQRGRGAKVSHTPPTSRKLLQLFPNLTNLNRSKSHESQLSNRIEEPPSSRGKKNRPVAALQLNGSTNSDDLRPPLSARTPGPYYIIDSPSQHRGSPQVPRRDLGLTFNHRFSTKSWFSQTCQVCHKSVMFGVKCKHCKLKCHNKCTRDAPTCRISFFAMPQIRRAESVPSDINNRIDHAVELPVQFCTLPKAVVKRDVPAVSSLRYSSSNPSSATSSAPSSPHGHQSSPHSVTTPPNTTPNASPAHRDQRFHFPDPPGSAEDQNSSGFNSGSHQENEAEEEVSEAPEQMESEESGSADPQPEDLDEDLDEDGLDDLRPSFRREHRFGGNLHRKISQNSVYLQEWNIPYEQLELGELIGKGRWGRVHRGRWHGEVAIRLVEVDGNNQEHLKLFKKEVMNYRQTRHDNVILFMGACMAPPHLAIITSFCRGVPLYSVVRERASLLDNNKTKQIAQDIVNGMSYLHAKDIVHKDLKSKNIFYDTNKVVISDFGLFGMSGVVDDRRRSSVLRIPRGWLFYLASEIVRKMRPDEDEDQLPFSKAADVYAFGTIWYELQTGMWPLEQQPVEARLWLLGSGEGIRRELGQAHLGKEVTEILSSCWSFDSSDRPSFTQLSDMLEKLPTLNRRLSHPGHFWKTQDLWDHRLCCQGSHSNCPFIYKYS